MTIALDIKQHFPIFAHQKQLGNQFHYLDNAATAHKPQAVIDAITKSYTDSYAPISRGLYPQAELATQEYEKAREHVATFIGASSKQLIFTKSATESLNMVAEYAIKPQLQAGDEVWISEAEHHANYLPWQRACAFTGAKLRVLQLDENSKLVLPPLSELNSGKVKCVALSLVSNVLGFYADVANIVAQVKSLGILTVVDAAQAISLHSVDVVKLDCDFLAFSGHKMFGPTGIGALYVAERADHLLQPMLVGGGMVDWVGDTFKDNVWTPGVEAFEAGSPNYSGALGMAAAAEFIDTLDISSIQKHVSQLAVSCGLAINELPGFIVFGDESNWQSGIVTFTHETMHPHDMAQICGEHGVAIRAGHHCAQPLMESLGHAATARASFSLYNDAKDLEALILSLITARELFA